MQDLMFLLKVFLMDEQSVQNDSARGKRRQFSG